MQSLRIVIALGGNAVSCPGEEGNISQQFLHTQQNVGPLADLILAGHHLVITHGNGPQVGSVMRRVEIARRFNVYPLPLDVAVADTQAGMGYMIAQCLTNELTARGAPRLCTPIITTVRVDAGDPAFAHPTKPVGAFLTREIAQEHARTEGWSVVEDAGRGWRRVVPSPVPLEIVELPLIRRVVEAGEIIVACGGGGIPVVRRSDGAYAGVEAVIDKDRTSALLAADIDADVLMILTGVDRVVLRFGKPDARPLDSMTVAEARRYLAEGEFPAGSMGPKIEAAVDFLERSKSSNPVVLITESHSAIAALEGRAGTRIMHN